MGPGHTYLKNMIPIVENCHGELKNRQILDNTKYKDNFEHQLVVAVKRQLKKRTEDR